MSLFNEQVKHVDVAIVGGGIIGICTAYALAREGVRVAVFEKGALACEQSSRNWGWVRTLGRDLPEVPLAMLARDLWADIQARVDVGFRRTGLFYLQEDPHDAQQHDAWLRSSRDLGLDAKILDATAVLHRLPRSQRDWTGALYSAADGVAEPGIATHRIADLARAHGAIIIEGCAVRGLDREAGRAVGIITEHGRVRAGSVLVAAGAWSRLFCGNVGVDFPQLKVRGSVLRTRPFDASLAITVNGKDFTCRKAADGGYVVSQFGASMADIVPDSFRLMPRFLKAWLANRSFIRVRLGRRFFEELAIPRRFGADQVTPFERHRVLDPRPSQRGLMRAWRTLTEAFPVFHGTSIASSWAGYIDVTPDALPVISAVDEVPGLYLASGFSGHGFGIAPAVGEVLADMLCGRPARVDIKPFDLSRFD